MVFQLKKVRSTLDLPKKIHLPRCGRSLPTPQLEKSRTIRLSRSFNMPQVWEGKKQLIQWSRLGKRCFLFMSSWWLVEPPILKNMIVKMGSCPQTIGGEISI